MDGIYPNTIVLRHLKVALEDLLTGEVGLTEGVRSVVQWSWSTHGLDERLFRPLVGVDSETDSFPLGAIRELWNADRLREIDQERLVVEARCRSLTMSSAKVLLEAVNQILPFSTFTNPNPP